MEALSTCYFEGRRGRGGSSKYPPFPPKAPEWDPTVGGPIKQQATDSPKLGFSPNATPKWVPWVPAKNDTPNSEAPATWGVRP